MNSKKSSPKFYIISKSMWQSDQWLILEGPFTSRKAADERVSELEARNGGGTVTQVGYEVRSLTNIKKQFGQDWFNYWRS